MEAARGLPAAAQGIGNRAAGSVAAGVSGGAVPTASDIVACAVSQWNEHAARRRHEGTASDARARSA